MNINQLIQNLKHGYAYTATNADGEQYQVLVPPNKYMIKASEVIANLVIELQHTNKIAVQNSKLAASAFAECERLTKELNDAKKTVQDQLGDPNDGNIERDSKGSTD